ncbi:MAG: hypothetical protein DI536_16985 [Archangium gephyra]|uniref:Lipoprotein n=1 Tax=Archangium gephyra TaxID=48 RepID=A0A2W5THD2_9BACT|nr:MAG: hypothetical protein DI536_16985 [Archangium gephyra]
MRLVLLSVLAASSLALAQPRGGPPEEAITACSGLAEGTACGFTHRGNNLTGTCRKGPDGQTAACLPEGAGRHRGPPEEAVTACSGKSAEATCSFTHHDRTVEGTCRTGPRGEALTCAPAGGHRGPPQEAITACASSTAGAACSVSFHGKTLNGTCSAGPDGSKLACLPARPPQP